MNARTAIKASLVAALFAAGAAAQAAPVGNGYTAQNEPSPVHSTTQSFAAAQAASLAQGPVANAYYYGYGDSNGAGQNVQQVRNGALDRETVRQAAIRAERSGNIEHGDAISF